MLDVRVHSMRDGLCTHVSITGVVCTVIILDSSMKYKTNGGAGHGVISYIKAYLTLEK